MNDKIAYFAGYDKNIYKFSIQDNGAELLVNRIPISPNSMLDGLIVNQVVATTEDVLYLVMNSELESLSYVFNSRNGSTFFQLSGALFNVESDKITFYENNFYAFIKDRQDKIQFCKPRYDNLKNPPIIYGDFSDTAAIRNYYMSLINGKAYLIYMRETNGRALLEIFSRQLVEGSSDVPPPVPKRVAQLYAHKGTEFLIYDNLIIICNHVSGEEYISIKLLV